MKSHLSLIILLMGDPNPYQFPSFDPNDFGITYPIGLSFFLLVPSPLATYTT